MRYRVKNWNNFSHYKDRKPCWIKLNRDLLDDINYHTLSDKAAKYLPLIWLLASEYSGFLPKIDVLAFRLRISKAETEELIAELANFIEKIDENPEPEAMEQPDSKLIANGYQNACLEEKRKEKKRKEEKRKNTRARDSTLIPEDIKTKNKDSSVGKADPPPPKTYQDLIREWNTFAAKYALPEVKELSEKRRDKLKIRLREENFDFDRILEEIQKQDFLRGANSRGWKVSLDFIISSKENYLKILEKAYENKASYPLNPVYKTDKQVEISW